MKERVTTNRVCECERNETLKNGKIGKRERKLLQGRETQVKEKREGEGARGMEREREEGEEGGWDEKRWQLRDFFRMKEMKP